MGNEQLGKTLSIVGGVLSLISGFVIVLYLVGFGSFIGEIFSELGDMFPAGIFTTIFVILLIMTVGGGITTLVGASRIDEYGLDKAGTIVIVGSVIGGINWISLIGGILLKQATSTSGILAGNQYRGPVQNTQYQPGPPAPVPRDGQKHFCRNCGVPFSEGAEFCQSCGERK